MTQEDKELLLQDLCGRLSYGVKVNTTNPAVKIGVISGISIKNKISVGTKYADIVFDCIEVKPYLRPMSSMTEEERQEIGILIKENRPNPYGIINNKGIDNLIFSVSVTSRILIDWLNAHHFDYRGLIEKGLAIAITEENNPYKE